MKSYPSIPKSVPHGQVVYAFDKLDGSNIRVEWHKKYAKDESRGFHKFGTRTRLVGPDDVMFGKVYNLVHEFDVLADVFMSYKIQEATLFFEFYGPSSFAGLHDTSEQHKLTLIDVSVYKKGFMAPDAFIDMFDGVVDIPKVLYVGEVDDKLISSVKNSELTGMTSEGVVCKYTENKLHKMFKIKSEFWLNRLRDMCKDDIDKFNSLA